MQIEPKWKYQTLIISDYFYKIINWIRVRRAGAPFYKPTQRWTQQRGFGGPQLSVSSVNWNGIRSELDLKSLTEKNRANSRSPQNRKPQETEPSAQQSTNIGDIITWIMRTIKIRRVFSFFNNYFSIRNSIWEILTDGLAWRCSHDVTAPLIENVNFWKRSK